MKVLTIVGTRPEAIKMAPLIIGLKKDKFFESKLCVTGQHREMLDQVLNIFKIKPDYDLDLMRKNQELIDLTSLIILKLKPILGAWKPELILVHGDTATTFSASLAAYFFKIPIAHIEAGLRSGSIYSPWPEEGIRKMVSVIAEYNFTPTQRSFNNLISEGVARSKIFVVGNTVVDALQMAIDTLNEDFKLIDKLKKEFSYLNESKKIILVTAHRREMLDSGLDNICAAISRVSLRNPEAVFVFPVHLNPKIRKTTEKHLSNIKNVFLIKPLNYISFLYLMSISFFILTDSGGIQEEAPSLGKPVLLLRETTERPEGVEAGIVKIVGYEINKIVTEIERLLDNNEIYDQMCSSINPYGDGLASQRILSELKNKNESI
jgi:UDP-N-acetylglucosamine 2-epimerase (non-hydrolysing)